MAHLRTMARRRFGSSRPTASNSNAATRSATTTALGFGAPGGKGQSILVPTVETLHWGLSLQYSTYYLTSRFTGGPPKDEPLNQLLPLVEFSFDTPRGQNTVATMNPGLAYVAVAWQLAAEVIVPLNREAGNSTGFRAQLLFFLDDLIPKLFDKPLLSDKPDRSLKALPDARLHFLLCRESELTGGHSLVFLTLDSVLKERECRLIRVCARSAGGSPPRRIGNEGKICS
jgi:hypothetical protein